MAVMQKVNTLLQRFGDPLKFATNTILNAALPGGAAVVQMVDNVIDWAIKTAKGQSDPGKVKPPAASADDLHRVEEILDVLGGDLQALLAQVAALESLPEVANQILEVALATDERCPAALDKIDQLARCFDRLEEQNRQLLQGNGYAGDMLEEMLPLLRRTAGIADFVEELRAAELSPADFRVQLQTFRQGERALSQGQVAEAGALFQQVAGKRPASAVAAVALAAVHGAGRKFKEAQDSISRAARLRPQDARLAELQRQVTQASLRGDTPAERPASVPQTFQIGDLLDGWKLEALLGQGGWGQVFRASQNGQSAALKVMRPELSRDPAFVARFKREIMALIKLGGHRHLVEIHNFGYATDWSCWYFVMALIEGMSLEHYLARKGALTLEQAARCFLAVADGLATVHDRGIVHRDIKPANIMLRRVGGPVLVDFGLAAVAGGMGRTRTGASAGYTPLFAAPEQLRKGQTDARSDVYSLAGSLYYSLLYLDAQHREPDLFDAALVPKEVRELRSGACTANQGSGQ